MGTISYEVVCQILAFHLDSSKLPYTVKQEVQTNIMDIEEANSSEGFSPINIIDIQLNEVKTSDTISPSQMAEFQKEDTHLSLVYEHVHNNSKPKLSNHILIIFSRSSPKDPVVLKFRSMHVLHGPMHA